MRNDPVNGGYKAGDLRDQMRGGEEAYTGGEHREGREEDETDPVDDDGRVLPLGDDVVGPVLALHAAGDVPQLPQDGGQLSVEAPSDSGRSGLVLRVVDVHDVGQ